VGDALLTRVMGEMRRLMSAPGEYLRGPLGTLRVKIIDNYEPRAPANETYLSSIPYFN
jgi:hypothetical protein